MKVKKDEKPDWDGTREFRSARSVFFPLFNFLFVYLNFDAFFFLSSYLMSANDTCK